MLDVRAHDDIARKATAVERLRMNMVHERCTRIVANMRLAAGVGSGESLGGSRGSRKPAFSAGVTVAIWVTLGTNSARMPRALHNV